MVFSLIVATLLLTVVVTRPLLLLPDGQSPRAVKGFLDASGHEDAHTEIFRLDGEWDFFPGKIVQPGDLPDEAPAYVAVPAVLSGLDLSAGTMRLRVRLPAGNDRRVALKAQYVASANEIWINGEKRSVSGRVSEDRDTYRAQYLPAEIHFTADTEDTEIVINFANFHHRRVRVSGVMLGPSPRISDLTHRSIIKEGILLGTLILASIYFATIHLVQHRESTYLYLSLIALVSAGRLSVVNERVLLRLLPAFPAELMMKIGYAGSMLVVPLAVIYLGEIYRSPVLKRVADISRYIVAALLITIIAAPLRVYDVIFQYGQFALMAGGLYALYVLLLRPWVDVHVRGRMLMTTAGALLLLAGINDVLRELSVLYTPELVSTGMVIFLLLQGLFLAWRFQDAFLRVEALSEENAGMVARITALNRNLEEKIRERTRELESANEKLEQLSRIDPLTELANRRAFDERYEVESAVSRRERTPLAVLMVDLDDFKGYNDNYGHVAGDECLRRVAAVLHAATNRASDLAARYGGEEFVLLLSNTNREGARAVAERVRSGIEALRIVHEYSPVAPVITTSVGVAVGVVGAGPGESLVNLADRALYMAKRAGRNRVEDAVIQPPR